MKSESPIADSAGGAGADGGGMSGDEIRDLIRERDAAEALRVSEEKFRSLAEEMPHFVWETDAAGEATYQNAKWHAYTGLTHGQTMRGGWLSAIHVDDAERIAEAWSEAVAHGVEYDVNCRFRRASDGEYRWFRVKGAPVRDRGGEIVRWVGTCTDIHEHWRAEESLRERTALLRAVIENTTDHIFAKDRQRRMTLANPATLDFLPHLSQAPGAGTKEIFSDLEQERRVRENDERVMSSGQAELIEEELGPPENLRIFQTLKAPLRDDAGEVVGLVGVARDITDVKAMEASIRASEKRVRRLIDNMLGFVGMLDLDGILLDVDAAALELGGLTREQAIGLKFWDAYWWSHDPAEQERLRRSIARAAAGETVRYDVAVRSAGDGRLMVDFQIKPVLDEAGRVILLIPSGVDISDRVRATAELRAAKEAAESASRAKDDFLAMLSHELRTPLNPALLISSSRCVDPALDPAVRADFESIRVAVTLQARLIDDLLDISRISSGKIELRPAMVDVHETLRLAAKVAESSAKEKRITIAFELAATAHRAVADEVRLRQAFWNVLCNAVKFTPEGGRVTIRTRAGESGTLRVEIVDTGCGIAPENVGRIFDAFSQEPDMHRRFGGLGLGLAISRRLVEMQGGSIRAESNGRGQGATFVVELPVLSASAPSPAPVPSRSPGAGGKSLRILLLEDHEQTRATLAALLCRRGYTVGFAGTIAEARALAAEASWDVLVSDLGLPDGSGHDLMRELAATGLPGVAMSGYGMAEDIELSVQVGFHSHLIKPVDILSLEEAIVAAANSRTA